MTTSEPIVQPGVRGEMRNLSLAVLAFFAACRGPLPVTYSEEVPAGSGTWTAAAGEPGWVKAPAPNPGHARFVIVTQSNDRNIATSNNGNAAARDIAGKVTLALRTVVPSPAAAAAAAAVPTALRLVHRACRDEVLTRELVPGNTLATVWGLYEIPIAELLAPLDEAHRKAARTVLEKL